jgi:hypothetical protein
MGGEMVYMSMVLAKVNEVFAATASFAPSDLVDALGDVETVAQAADRLGYHDVVAPEWQQPLLDFLATIPPSIDAAGMAAARSALERGLRVTVTWMPDYAFGLRVWEVSKTDDTGWVGMVNVQINSPDPELEQPVLN